MSNQGNVPKFASFRPKAKPEDASSTDTEGKQYGSRDDSGEDSRQAPPTKAGGYVGAGGDGLSKRVEHGHSRSSRRDHPSKSRAANIPEAQGLKSRDLPLHQPETSERLYQIDTKGDPHNLVYGTIHRYSVPNYYRSGSGRVLGLPRRLRIERNIAEKNIIISDSISSQAKRREKYSFARNERRPIRKLRLRKEAAPSLNESSKEFIPLKGSNTNKQDGAEDPFLEVSETEVDRDYRSIEGKAKTKANPADRDLEYATDTSASDYEAVTLDASDASIRARGVALSEAADKDPTSISNWVDLIHHQDVILGHRNSGGGRRPTEAESRSTADIKLSMYEKALDRVSKSEKGYEKLLLGMIETGSKIWDHKTQIKKWQAILRDHPSSINLWTRYLDFNQTMFMAFRVDALRGVYVECLGVLKAALCQSSTSIEASYDIERNLIYVILRFTLFMREAGYTESAIAVWQGLLELNFFAPQSSLLPTANADSLLSSFERFWDSEVPRIGEAGAKGWAASAAEDVAQDIAEESTVALDAHRATSDIFRDWLVAERQHALASRRVARTTDDLPEDDPYRVMFYSDIADFLLRFSSTEARETLIFGFLAFCRLPPPPLLELDRKTRSWWNDAFIRTDMLEQDNILQCGMLDREELEEDDASVRRGPFALAFRNFVVSTETLFAQKEIWFSCHDAWTSRYSNGEGPVELPWLRQVLRSLVAAKASGSALAELHLAFEWRNHPESARKSAKSVLKAFPSSFRLYNAYALIEWRLGNISAAENVYSKALSMSSSLSSEERDDDTLLWRSWIWEILQLDSNRALRTILGIADGRAPAGNSSSMVHVESSIGLMAVNAPEFLKAKRFLELGLESAISSSKAARIVHLTDLLSLLIYLSQDRAIDAALSIYKKTLSTLSSHPDSANHVTTIELLHQTKARLLYHHATTSHLFQPALLRAEFGTSIELFPQNTIFLSLYAWNEKRFRIDDRVRSLMRDVVLKEDQEESVVGWVFAVWNELNGTLGGGHNANSTKAVFERAVDERSRTRSSASLWSLYIVFAVQSLPEKESIAVFHRAIRNCPWAKTLYMLAFKHLAAAMTQDDLRRVYEVMREKELRIHVELEDFLERRREGPGQRMVLDARDER